VIYQDPLAFLVGLEGIALLDGWAGDHDRAFTDARLAEIRRLLADEKLQDRGVSAERHVGELDRLPLPDDSVDVIVCALALVHVPHLQPVFVEFARVLRPGGDLVISDIHHELVTRGSVISARGPAGARWVAATYRHQLGDYLRPALSVGLQVRRCEEPRVSRSAGPLPEPAPDIGDWRDWPWSLMDYLPSAAQAAGGRPSLVIWHFQLPAA
jgi:SAM-dependent methyltransferase